MTSDTSVPASKRVPEEVATRVWDRTVRDTLSTWCGETSVDRDAVLRDLSAAWTETVLPACRSLEILAAQAPPAPASSTASRLSDLERECAELETLFAQRQAELRAAKSDARSSLEQKLCSLGAPVAPPSAEPDAAKCREKKTSMTEDPPRKGGGCGPSEARFQEVLETQDRTLRELAQARERATAAAGKAKRLEEVSKVPPALPAV